MKRFRIKKRSSAASQVRCKKNLQKRPGWFGFTLTELLVVVVVVGILSAVAVPKFSRAVETRRTAEAEEMLLAIRTEQEKRCELDQKYAVEFDKLNQLVRVPQTDHYTYSLSSGGASAVSRGKSYSLSVPSYADGRLCCEGSYCEKLNKNYPACSALSGVKRESACELSACEINPNSCSCDSYAASHCECTGTCDPCSGKTCSGSSSRSCPSGYSGTQYRMCSCGEWSDWTGTCAPDEPEDPCAGKTCSGPSSQSCSSGYSGTQTRTCTCGEWSAWTGTCTPLPPEAKECSGPSSESCGCNNGGTQTRTCDTATGTWSAWGSCSVSDACACEASSKPAEEQPCGSCGQKQTRNVSCDTSTGAWKMGGWSSCPADPTCSGSATQACPNDKTGTQTRTCTCGEWSEWTGRCLPKLEDPGFWTYAGTLYDGRCSQNSTIDVPASTHYVNCPGNVNGAGATCKPGRDGRCWVRSEGGICVTSRVYECRKRDVIL